MESQIIMGIDPGLANTGWGIIRCGGTHVAPVAYGCITTTKSHDLPTRLAIIHDNLLEIIDRYLPTELSVEGIYFGNNAKSAIPTAQARGAALVACAYRGLEYGEYTPMQIKQALVGTARRTSGRSSTWCVPCSSSTTSRVPITPQTPWPRPSRMRGFARPESSNSRSDSAVPRAPSRGEPT